MKITRKRMLEETKIKIGKANKKLVDINCKNCGIVFSPVASKITFCSRVCAGLYKRGKPSWNKVIKGFRAGEGHHWYGKNHSGENNGTYIKDRSKLKKTGDAEKDRRSSAYVTWRNSVWLRDNFKCKIANPDCSGRIEAHHILGWIAYPELRYEINNGITLCHAHHPRKRAEEKRLEPLFMELVSVSKTTI